MVIITNTLQIYKYILK